MTAKQKTAALLLLTLLFASSKPSNARKRTANPGRSVDGGSAQFVPLKIYRSFLVVAEGQIGGLPERQNFIVDTGTAPSIIATRLARQLGLAAVPSQFTALGKILPAQMAIVPEIDLGPIRAVSMPVQVQDLSRLERVFGIPISGIIGLDVLSKSSFHLDYDKREIEFGEVSNEGIPVAYDAHTGLAVAGMRLAGKEVHMLVDTGSDRFLIFGGCFPEAKRLGLRATRQTGTSIAEKGAPVQEFSAPEIIFGGQRFSQESAYLVPEITDPVFDGLLSVRALGFRGLSFDQGSSTLYLQN